MASAVFELVILSLPSLIYIRRLRRAGRSQRQSLTAVGLQPGTLATYALALALVIPVTALAAILGFRPHLCVSQQLALVAVLLVAVGRARLGAPSP